MCRDNCETWLTPTDSRVLMVVLLAQAEEGLVGPDDVAELHFWSSWRLLANASSRWVKRRTFTHISPASLASAPPSCTPGRCCNRARCQTPADVCGLNRNPGVDERCGTNALLFTAMDQQTRGTHDNSSDVGQTTRGTRHTDQPPHHAVAQCCATPCRRPSAASASSASLSPPAHPARSRSSWRRSLGSPCAPWRNAPLWIAPCCENA